VLLRCRRLIAPESASGAEIKAPEDWRPRFVKQRYAKLLEILSSRMDEKTLNETLFELALLFRPG